MIEVKFIISALVFSVIGLVVLFASFFIFDKLTPGKLWEEIVDKQNTAMAIAAGATILAIAQIVAAAIHG